MRQTGKTVGIACFYSWLPTATENSRFSLMHHSAAGAIENLRTIKGIIENLPDYLTLADPNDTDNVTSLIRSVTNVRVLARSPGNDPTAAEKAGRGSTEPGQWYDELAFMRYNEIVFAAATPANNTASDEAKKRNRPYFLAISTTPGDLTNEHGIYAYKMLNQAAVFNEEFYDWDVETVKKYIYANSTNDFVYIKFNHLQLGKDDAWFNKQCRSIGMDIARIRREFLIQWSRSSDLSPFAKEYTDRLQEHQKEAIDSIIIDNKYTLNIYRTDIDFHSNSIMIGVDCATGMSLDRSALVVYDVNTGHIIATFKNALMDSFDLQMFIYTVVKKYFVRSTLVIERNINGSTIIDNLLRTDIKDRIYWEKKEKLAENTRDDVRMKRTVKKVHQYYGHVTTKETRPMMMELLGDSVINDYDTFNCPDIIEEILGLERVKGRIDHSSTTHDDLVMAYLSVRYIHAHGKNLAKFFIPKPNTRVGEHGSLTQKEQVKRFKSVANHNISDRSQYVQNIQAVQMYQDYIQEKEALDEILENKSKSILSSFSEWNS